MLFKSIDISGQKFGKLTAIRNTGTKTKWDTYIWECKCDCGNIVYLDCHKLRSGNTKSCGCLYIEKAKHMASKYITKHGKSHTRLYKTYQNIKRRCYNKNDKSYKYYGNRGICMCKEWECDFMSFYNWAISNGYNDKLTIERIDVNGNYCPKNCTWVSLKEQQKNKRNNIHFNINGNDIIQSELCKSKKINVNNFRHMLLKGKSVEEILTLQEKKKTMFPIEFIMNLYGISRSTVINYIKSGKIKGEKVGRNWKITKHEFNYIRTNGLRR